MRKEGVLKRSVAELTSIVTQDHLKALYYMLCDGHGPTSWAPFQYIKTVFPGIGIPVIKDPSRRASVY